MQKTLLPHFLISFVIIISACTPSKDTTIFHIESPAPRGSELPFLYTDNTGKVFLSWVEPGSSDDEYRLMYSKLNNGQWSNPHEVASSNSWFVNWADYPSVIAHSGEAMAAHQLTKIPGNTYSYNVNITQRKKNNNWSKPLTPHSDGTATEHGFVSMIPMDAASIMAIWLDGRRTDNRSDEEYFDLDKAMTLRSAIIDSAGSVRNPELIDESVCDCCQTTMVMTERGPIAAYRDRTGDEIRDIYITRYHKGSWSEPVPVYKDGWRIGACPVNGPKIAAKGSVVVVAWYTGAGSNPTVKAAVSTDFGSSFGEPFIINNNGTQGRVDVAIADSNSAYISEISKSQDKYYLAVHKLSLSERTTTPYKVTEMNGSRRSGFPQMELINDELILAWTEVAEDNSARVKTGMVNNP